MQLTATYRQKVPIAQYVRIIDAQIAVRFCAICSIYIMPKALGDILTVNIFIGGCAFSLTKLVCAAILRQYIPTLHCSNAKCVRGHAQCSRRGPLKLNSAYGDLLAKPCKIRDDDVALVLLFMDPSILH